MQVVCNTNDEREELKKAFFLLKSTTGERTSLSLLKIIRNITKCQELGFKENDKLLISESEEGKIVVERIWDDEKWD